MIIAIDGPAGAGKSTIAKNLAARLGFFYVDTGAMYRALTLKVIKNKLNFEDTKTLLELAHNTEISLRQQKDKKMRIFLDGDDVSEQIRAPELTQSVFKIARIPEIRELMVAWQREYGRDHSIVMEGRDIGTVVFPKAEKKFYLDATCQIRAQRRFKELKDKGVEADLEEIIRQIQQRDQRDKNRSCGPLKKAADAVYIDTSDLNITQVLEALLGYIGDE